MCVISCSNRQLLAAQEMLLSALPWARVASFAIHDENDFRQFPTIDSWRALGAKGQPGMYKSPNALVFGAS